MQQPASVTIYNDLTPSPTTPWLPYPAHGCFYRLNLGTLEYSPIFTDGSRDEQNEAEVTEIGAEERSSVMSLMNAQILTAKAERVTADAELAFWDTVAKAYPEIHTGDLEPFAAIRFSEACRLAVDAWLLFNR